LINDRLIKITIESSKNSMISIYVNCYEI